MYVCIHQMLSENLLISRTVTGAGDTVVNKADTVPAITDLMVY